MQVMKKA